jgi:hypothetical protein
LDGKDYGQCFQYFEISIMKKSENPVAAEKLKWEDYKKDKAN